MLNKEKSKEYLTLLENIKSIKENLKNLEVSKKIYEQEFIENLNQNKALEYFDEDNGVTFAISKRTTKKVNLDFVVENLDNYQTFYTFNESEFKKSKDPIVKNFIKNNENEVFIKETKITGIKVKAVEVDIEGIEKDEL